MVYNMSVPLQLQEMCEIHSNCHITYYMLYHIICFSRDNVLSVEIYFETFRYEELLTEASYTVRSCPIRVQCVETSNVFGT